MSTMSEKTLTRLSATELAAAIARGDVSAIEAVEAHIARIEQVNPTINAVVVKRYDEARAEARAADDRRGWGEPLAPLHGVPITIKESLDLSGTPSTYGLTTRAHTRAERDNRFVARVRGAGAIILGKTNVPQMLLYIESDNPVYGRTNNPWNQARTSGGSSGGQAAIIATGGSPLGLGTDIGGSVRVPASFCGIASLKPTAGRMPDDSSFGMSLGQRAIISQVAPMARIVDDLTLALQVMNGGDNPNSEPPMPLGDPATVDVSKLRVAYYTDDKTLGAAPAVRRSVIEAAGMLAGRGAQVVEWQPPDVTTALHIFYGILSADGGRGAAEMASGSKKDPRIATLLRLAGAPLPVNMTLRGALAATGQRNTRQVLQAFGHRDTLHYWQLVEAQMDYQRRFLDALDQDAGGPFDVIICPACALPAFPHGASADLLAGGGYATLYNVLGYPAGVVPLTRVQQDEESSRKRSLDRMERSARIAEAGSVGLPVGVQVVARPWREHVALAAMSAIQAAARLRSDYPQQPPL